MVLNESVKQTKDLRPIFYFPTTYFVHLAVGYFSGIYGYNGIFCINYNRTKGDVIISDKNNTEVEKITLSAFVKSTASGDATYKAVNQIGTVYVVGSSPREVVYPCSLVEMPLFKLTNWRSTIHSDQSPDMMSNLISVQSILTLAIFFATILVQVSASWGPWGEYSSCSRTCGGGVRSRTRRCTSPRSNSCTGESVSYESCQTKACSDGAVDFRIQQCNSHKHDDNVWISHYDMSSPCTLFCENQLGQVVKKRDTVLDGTTCDSHHSFGLCVAGVCKQVGCDHVIGSTKTVDDCLVCGGRGENCDSLSGTSEDTTLKVGETSNLATFPFGTTKLEIRATTREPAIIELRATDGEVFNLTEYLTDGSHNRSVNFYGAVGMVKPIDNGFRLTARGPLRRTLHLKVQPSGASPTIKYDYSIPLSRFIEKDPQLRFTWVDGTWTSCSAICGPGQQRRAVNCIDRSNGQIVSRDLCPAKDMPALSRACQYRPCHQTLEEKYKWIPGTFSDCNTECGAGHQTQRMFCLQTEHNSESAYVPDAECEQHIGKKPVVRRACFGTETQCGNWITGVWSQCSVTCGQGRQTRSVACEKIYQNDDDEDDGEDESSPSDDQSLCPADSRPATEQSCNLGNCSDLTDEEISIVTSPDMMSNLISVQSILTLAIFFATILVQVSASWGPWGEYSSCSRTCGGGVRSRTRRCTSPRSNSCTGESVSYESCQTKACSDGAVDFRTQQCNSLKQDDNVWISHYDMSSPCTLFCENQLGQVAKKRDTVLDGTTCDSHHSFGLCVAGVCKQVGCDHVIGSTKTVDDCLVCGGRGENCDSLSGTSEDTTLKVGETSNLVTFPFGTTKLEIRATTREPAIIELRATDGEVFNLTEYLTDGSHNRSVDFYGAVGMVKPIDNGFRLTARGPLSRTLHLKVQPSGASPTIKYDYSIPISRFIEKDPQLRFTWVDGTWTSCSDICGPGQQRRAVNCIDRSSGQIVSRDLCPAKDMPALSRACQNRPCHQTLEEKYKWIPGTFSDCNTECGAGHQTQRMFCLQTEHNSESAYVPDAECVQHIGKKPVVRRACFGTETQCGNWITGVWSQ
ncbi:A disintegrin and metalloproteinase with thrombospondin motifs 2, partial [Bulinus truncatus]